eukprot:scaffold24263_cov69-Phaeocystis_antarctica.AAC.15
MLSRRNVWKRKISRSCKSCEGDTEKTVTAAGVGRGEASAQACPTRTMAVQLLAVPGAGARACPRGRRTRRSGARPPAAPRRARPAPSRTAARARPAAAPVAAASRRLRREHASRARARRARDGEERRVQGVLRCARAQPQPAAAPQLLVGRAAARSECGLETEAQPLLDEDVAAAPVALLHLEEDLGAVRAGGGALLDLAHPWPQLRQERGDAREEEEAWTPMGG